MCLNCPSVPAASMSVNRIYIYAKIYIIYRAYGVSLCEISPDDCALFLPQSKTIIIIS